MCLARARPPTVSLVRIRLQRIRRVLQLLARGWQGCGGAARGVALPQQRADPAGALARDDARHAGAAALVGVGLQAELLEHKRCPPRVVLGPSSSSSSSSALEPPSTPAKPRPGEATELRRL